MKNILDLNELGIDTNKDIDIVLKEISDKWNDKPKNYIGDVKWVLYQYICNMNTEGKDLISIRCGNFALSKLISMAGMNFRNNNADVVSFNLNINGESLIVRHIPTLDKKQLILSCDHEFISKEQDEIIHPNDIVLYYA